MHEAVFAEAYPFARRAAEVRSAAAVAIGGLSAFDREDIEQEAMVGFWQALPGYDRSRACPRTYAELVVSTRIASALRAYNAWKRAVPLDDVLSTEVWEPAQFVDLRADVDRVLAGLNERDRRLASVLVDHTPSEAGRVLGVARSTVYERIDGLRGAFEHAGLGRVRGSRHGRKVRT
jgi:RNA polymerase sigma factor (sigma-70 family)